MAITRTRRYELMTTDADGAETFFAEVVDRSIAPEQDGEAGAAIARSSAASEESDHEQDDDLPVV